MCDDDPSLATPPVPAEVPKVVAPWVLEQQAAMASAPVLEPAVVGGASLPVAVGGTGATAGWYPDPEGRPAHRYWDGHAWTAFAPYGDGPANRHPVLPRVRSKRRFYDLHAFEDRIVLDPVKQATQQIVGYALFGIVGALIGQRIARQSDDVRIARTSTTSAEDLEAGGAQVLPHETIASLVAKQHGSGGRIRITRTGGSEWKMSWTNESAKGYDVESILHAAAPGRSLVEMVPGARARRMVGIALVTVVIVVGLAALAIAGGDPSTATPPSPASPTAVPPAVEARAPLARACGPWIALSQRETPPSIDELRMIVKAMRPDLEAAAGADASFRTAANSIAFLDSYLTIPSEELQPRVEPAAADIDAACSRSS